VLLDTPQQIYKVSDKTQRIVPDGVGLATIESRARRAITQKAGWVEYDLRNVGLAIAMVGLDDNYTVVNIIKPMLENGIDVYAEIVKGFGVPLNDDTRSIAKKAIYRILNGAGFDSALKHTTAAYRKSGYEVPDSPQAKTWTILLGLDDATKYLKKRIRDHKGIHLINGKWFRLPMKGKGKTYNYGTVLHNLYSAYEQEIIAAAYDLAEKNANHFVITLYQYDGFDVKFYDNKEYWSRRIIEAVNAKALEMGVITELTRKS
jgi:hypothetical protein